MSAENESLLEFPCSFPIKVLGPADPDMARVIGAVVRELAPDFAAETIAVRPSSGGRYQALSLVVNARDRAQLDAIYRALSSHPMVKFVL